MKMLGHHHHPDQRKLIPQTNFAENINEEVARGPNGAAADGGNNYK
jgi:hypothetical protein